MKRKLLIATGLLLAVFAPFSVFADTIPKYLVPENCIAGCPCSLCDLYNLARNVMDFLLFAVSVPIGAAMFLYGGVLLMTSGGSEDKIKKGRKTITGAVIGMALAFFAWAIMNVVLSVVGFQINFRGALKSWYQPPTCVSGGGDDTCTTKLPELPRGSGPGTSGKKFTGSIDDYCYKDGYYICDTSGMDYYNGTEGIHQEQKNWNKVEFSPELNAQIERFASENGIDPARLKAIIAAESSGNPGAEHMDKDGKSSYGLMQIRPDTLRTLDPSLRKASDADLAQLLKNPEYNLEVGAKYYADLLVKYKGDETLASAAFNGGPGANGDSLHCPGLRRWQCEYDQLGCYNTEVTGCKPNTGYRVTREYTRKIDDLENKYR